LGRSIGDDDDDDDAAGPPDDAYLSCASDSSW
jgi:hypothetical protein